MKMSTKSGTMCLLVIAAFLLSPCAVMLAAAAADESEPNAIWVATSTDIGTARVSIQAKFSVIN